MFYDLNSYYPSSDQNVNNVDLQSKVEEIKIPIEKFDNEEQKEVVNYIENEKKNEINPNLDPRWGSKKVSNVSSKKGKKAESKIFAKKEKTKSKTKKGLLKSIINPLDFQLQMHYDYSLLGKTSKSFAKDFLSDFNSRKDVDGEEEEALWSESVIRKAIGKKEPGNFYEENKIDKNFIKTAESIMIDENILKEKPSMTTTKPTIKTTVSTTTEILFKKDSKQKGKRRKIKKKSKRKKLNYISDYQKKEFKVEDEVSKKVSLPMKKEWEHIFQSSTTSIPTTSETTNEIKDRHEKPKNNNDSGFLKTLVSQYCDIEHSIGILQLCNSRILSRNRYDRPQGLTLPSKPTYYGRNDRKIQKPYLFNPPPTIFHRVSNAVFSAFASHHE